MVKCFRPVLMFIFLLFSQCRLDHDKQQKKGLVDDRLFHHGSNVSVASEYPTVFILGSLKSGSSSMYAHLTKHPKLCGGQHKEPGYFKMTGGGDFSYDHGKLAYRSNYEYNKNCVPRNGEGCMDVRKCKNVPGARFIDGTAMMHQMPVVMERMVEAFTEEERKSLKFVVLLREPVARDYSLYSHASRKHLDRGLSFAKLFTLTELMEKTEFSNSTHKTIEHFFLDYLDEVSTFLTVFQRDQIFILNSDLVFSEGPSVMKRLASFLGINMIDAWKVAFPRDDHQSAIELQHPKCSPLHVPLLDCALRDELIEKNKPLNKKLYQWMQTVGPRPLTEPFFPPYNDTKTASMACSPNARLSYNLLIEDCLKRLDNAVHCTCGGHFLDCEIKRVCSLQTRNISELIL